MTFKNVLPGLEFTTFLNLNGIGDGNNKNLTHHVFKYKHTKWSHCCITASLNYKNTMINRITMETVACLRSSSISSMILSVEPLITIVAIALSSFSKI
jgi:hypothetical protein